MLGRAKVLRLLPFLLALATGGLLSDAWRAPAAAQEPEPALLERVMASLSVEDRIGQLVMVNFVGDDVSPESDIAGLIRDFNVGAVLVTASNGNIVNRGDTPVQIATLTDGLQERAYESTRRGAGADEYFVPLLIATDNEGDLFPFTNVTNGYTALPNNMTIGATFSKTLAEAAGRIVGGELSAAGINMLLGPVVDVLDAPQSGGDGDIGIRSFGGNAAWVGSLGRAYVRGVHEGSGGRMLTVAKHFPGHGGSDRSTDDEVPTVNKSLAQLRASELAPFGVVSGEGTDAGTTDAIMVSHIRYRNLLASAETPFTRPISLDAGALRTLMALPEFSAWRRDHLLMADSLGVPAIKRWYAREEGQPEFPNRTVVREALMAGNDLLPLVEFYVDPANRGWKDNQLPLIQDSILYMREQYGADPDFRRRADDAVRRVIAAKLRLYPGLTREEVRVDAALAAEVAGGGAAEMAALADAALTLIYPPSVEELRSRLPRGPLSPEKVVIIECWEDCYPYRVMRQAALQERLLSLYGPDGSGRLAEEDVSTISFGDLDDWLSAPAAPGNAATAKAVADAAWLVFALSEYNPVGRPASAAVKRFLDVTPVDLRNKNLVAIAYNVPYQLDSTQISKLAAYFAVYNKTDYAIEAGFRALFGDATAAGNSPVNVSGVFYSVAEATQPDPEQRVSVSVFGAAADEVPDGDAVALFTSPVRDRNGNPVPDGTRASLTLAKQGSSPETQAVETVDGVAVATLSLDGAGSYSATASVGGLSTEPLAITVGGGQAPVPPPEIPVPAEADGGVSPLLLALAIGVPAIAVAAAGGLGIAVWSRRRRASSMRAAATVAAERPPDAALRIDAETRRVYVHGVEAKPPLSNEQFRLLLHLYERAGKVVAREDLVRHVWPEAHTEGVSEEALDALVRRVRERIKQAGGERSYIVTLRGQGFRLEV